MSSIRSLEPPQISIVGTPISLISRDEFLQVLKRWIADPHDRYVVFRDVHGVIAARNDADLDLSHKRADIVAADGMPVVWALRATGENVSRLCGPDTMLAACEYGLAFGWRHYFYGGAPGVAEKLVEKLRIKYPELKVVGTQCPPFHPHSPQENNEACARIRLARPDLIWVGLGTPKQEIWMSEHQGQCGGAVMLGVGAAFDFHSGIIRRAPRWLQGIGLEWAFRLFAEPRRLWRRYLLIAPTFLPLAIWEVIQRRRAQASTLRREDFV